VSNTVINGTYRVIMIMYDTICIKLIDTCSLLQIFNHGNLINSKKAIEI